MNIIGGVTTDHTFLLLLTVLSHSQASALLLQLANTLLLSPSSKEMSIQILSGAKGWPPRPHPGRVLAPFLKSTLFRVLYKWVWTALWPLAGQKTGRRPSWEKDLWPDNEDFSWCDILLCADVLSWVPWVTTKADLRLLNSQLLFCLTGFASTRDLALMKLRSFASQWITALVHARAWALQEKGATETSDGAARWIKGLDTNFFLVTGLVVLLLELDLFRRNWTSTAVYSSGEICAKEICCP